MHATNCDACIGIKEWADKGRDTAPSPTAEECEV